MQRWRLRHRFGLRWRRRLCKTCITPGQRPCNEVRIWRKNMLRLRTWAIMDVQTATPSTGVGGPPSRVLFVAHELLHLMDRPDHGRKWHNLIRLNPQPHFLLKGMDLRQHPCYFLRIHARTKTPQKLDNVGIMRPRLHHEVGTDNGHRTHTSLVADNASILLALEPPVQAH